MTLALLRKPFVFMRHGETAANAQHLMCGRLDWPLTAQGQAQARATQPWLGPVDWSCVAVSPALRAQQTAQAALSPKHRLRTYADLRERDWGDLEGRPLSEHPGYEGTPANGEPWQDFASRVTHALNAILQEHERPLIVAHSGVWRVVQFLLHGSAQGARLGHAVPMQLTPTKVALLHPTGWHVQPLMPATTDPRG